MHFENEWLAQYPRPLYCVHGLIMVANLLDKQGFQQVLECKHIKDVPTTLKNPQANAICEQMNQTVGNTLRTLCHAHPPQDIQQVQNIIDSAIATGCFSCNKSSHSSNNERPGGWIGISCTKTCFLIFLC
jgi:hypothetical protein